MNNQLYEDKRLEDYKKKYSQENKATSCIEKAAYYILHEFHYNILDLEEDYGIASVDALFEGIIGCCSCDYSTNNAVIFNEKEGYKKIDEYFYPKLKNKRKNLLLRVLNQGEKTMAYATAFHKAIYKKDGSSKRGNVFPAFMDDSDPPNLLKYGEKDGKLKYGTEEWDFSEHHDYNEDQKRLFHIEPHKID
jgi:hypothetical protein